MSDGGDTDNDAYSGQVDFERFFDLAVDVLVVTRPDGYFRMVNQAFADMLGVDRQVVLDNPWSEFVHPDDREVSVEENEREFEVDHRTMHFENRYVGVDGEVHWLEWNAELDPNTGLVYGLARDVTQQRRSREALEAALIAAEEARAAAEAANRAKSEFLSRMSHELRTPMNAILGFGQLLELDDISPRQAESVQHILRAGRHLLSLINEVLDIARIEIGEISLSVEPVRVADTVAEVISLLGPMATTQGVALGWRPGEHDVAVQADRRRLQQVLLNYLSNAVKYTPPGSTVQVTTEIRDDDWLRIAVVDDGPGIAPELIDRLFNPFERIGAETTEVEGTGLGLAHSKALAQRMGGAVGVDSTFGAGSTFWVELPLASHSVTAPSRFEVSSVGTEESITGTILYIEDNPANTQLFERMLEYRPGIRLHSAMLGRLGLALAGDQQPDLIVLDLHLPDISGETVLNELLADPRTRQIPIVVLSADATRRQIDQLLALGAAAYVTKPLDVARLLTVIDTHLA